MGTRTFFSVHSVVNAGGALRLLKSQCDGSGESRQKARRKLERGLMPNEHVIADAKRILVCAVFPLMLLDAHRASSMSLAIKKIGDIHHTSGYKQYCHERNQANDCKLGLISRCGHRKNAGRPKVYVRRCIVHIGKSYI